MRDPTFPRSATVVSALLDHARSLITASKQEGARVTLSNAIEIASSLQSVPNALCAQLLVERAQVCLHLGDHQTAIGDCTRAQAIDPSTAAVAAALISKAQLQ